MHRASTWPEVRSFLLTTVRGAELGAATMLVVAAVETGVVILDGSIAVGGAYRFASQASVLLLAVGAAVGWVQGNIFAATERLFRKPRATARAVIYAFCTSVPLSALWVELSRARWSELGGPAKTAMVAGLVLLQPALYGVTRVVLSAARAFAGQSARRAATANETGPTPRVRHRVAIVAAAVVVAMSLYWADAWLLPGLYEPMHQGLALASFAACELAVLGLAGLIPDSVRSLYRRLAWVIVGVTIVLPGVRNLRLLGGDPVLTFAAVERTHIEAKVIRALREAVDRDGDDHSPVLGGGDCDDSKPGINSGALDLPENGIDEDCSGKDLRLEDLVRRATVKRPRAPGRPYNVLLVTIDSMRADHVGLFGYGRPTTRHIDRLGRSALAFERAYAQANNTAASIPSLVTGRYPSSSPWSYNHPEQVGAGWAYVIDDGNLTLAELLRSRGYRTTLIVPSGPIVRLGLAQGYDETLRDQANPVEDLKRLTKLGSKEPWHVWIHLDHPHAPYDKHAGFDFGDRPIDRYDSEIAAADAMVGALITTLGDSGAWDKTIVVVTADHGEEFRDHGGTQHATTLYNELIRVPLIVRIPGVEHRLVTSPVELVDVLPTLLEAVGVSAPAWLDGNSLFDEIHSSQDSAGTAYSEKYNGRVLGSAFMKGDWKVISHRRENAVELYNLRTDPREKANLAQSEPAILTRLRSELGSLSARRELMLLANARRHAEGVLRLARGFDLLQRPELLKDAIRIVRHAGDDRVAPALERALQSARIPRELRLDLVGALEAIGKTKSLQSLVRLTASADPMIAKAAKAAVSRLTNTAENPFAASDRARAARDIELIDFGTVSGHARVLGGVGRRRTDGIRSIAWSKGPVSRVAFWIDPKAGPSSGDYRINAVGRVAPLAAEGQAGVHVESIPVSVAINGQPIGKVDVARAFETHPLRVPRSVLQKGPNDIALGYPAPADARTDSLAVEWDYLIVLPEQPTTLDVLPCTPPDIVRLSNGWADLDTWKGHVHRLSKGAFSELSFELNLLPGDYRLRYEAAARDRETTVTFVVNERAIGSVKLGTEWSAGDLIVGAGALVKNRNTLRFHYASGAEGGRDSDGFAVRWRAINLAP